MRASSAWLTVAFALGLVAGDAWPEVAPLALALGFGACAGSWRLRRRPRACAALACIAALAAGAGLLGRRVERASAQLRAPGGEALVEGRVAATLRMPGATRVELREVAWVRPEGARAARAELWLDANTAPPPLGSRIRAAVRIRTLAAGAANPGGRDAARALARRGIGASLRAADPLLVRVVGPPDFAPSTWIAGARLRASERLRSFGRGGALLAALGLGDAAGLPERDRRAWAALGIAHLLAVSGLHLALVGAAAYGLAASALARRTRWVARWDTRRGALAGALASAAVYAVLSGLATPALRSLAVLAALAAAAFRRRAAAGARALVNAALLVIALEPSALFAPGAQLSFAAAAALVLAPASHAERAGGRLRRALAAAVSTTARATLATAPIAALHFGAAPPLAGLANLVAVPLTAAVLMPLAFAASASALFLPETTPAPAFAGAAAVAEWALDAAATLAADVPRVAPHPPALAALAVCALAAGFGLATRRLAPRLASAFAAQAALAFLPPPATLPHEPRIVFLDVGHGDAALVQSVDFALLVDAGVASPDGWDAGARTVVPALAALGVRRLDALAISHADLDHRGGAGAVLASFPCAELWLPRGALGDGAFAPLLADARGRGVQVREVGAGDPAIQRPGLRIAPLWPPGDARPYSDNDRSLVLWVELGELRVSLLGDLEAAGELALLASGAELRSDVVKLAHHGSRSSTTAELLEAARPRLAIASAPLRGRFGWPHAAVRARLAEREISLAWTGRDGAVIVSARGTPCVRRWRGSAACIPVSDFWDDPRSRAQLASPP